VGTAFEERRRSPRVQVSADAASVTLSSSATVQVLDISQSGMLIASGLPAEVGRRGRLKVRLGADSVWVDVEVRRVQKDRVGGAGPYMLGVEYVGLDDALRRRIAEFLRSD
jgi:c-di-GMP-binding flagellar brake protein YcgR